MATGLEAVGPADLPDALAEERALVVDLDRPSSAAELSRAATAARAADVALVGVLGQRSAPQLAGLVEALSTTLVQGSSDRRDVVGVADLDQALEAIAENVSRSPQAAATLPGLLRLTAAVPVREGLVAESLAYSLLLCGPEFAAWRASRPRRQVPAFGEPAVLLQRDGNRLLVTLNRPQRHNAFSAEVRDALLGALEVAVLDDSVDAVELRGNGRSFCSGGDLDEFGTAKDLVAAHLLRVRHSAGRVVDELAARTTVYLHGACIGAGLEVPAFAGRVVAAPDTSLQLPELRMGLVPGAGGTVSVTRRIGRWRTAYLVLTSAVLDAATAHEWGLVDQLAP
ncbi:MAG: enoyl-CoA hydratase/isomerase family protein [Mycobacteriales bacterium]